MTGSTIRWICSQKIAHKCLGALTTDISMTEIVSNVEHSHAPDYDYIQALKVRCTMKSTAKTNHGKPSQIVTDAFHEFPPAVIVAGGSYNALKQVAQRAKRGATPKNPATIGDIPFPLPEGYARYIIYDNNSQKRIIIIATDDGLKLLGNSDT